MLAMMLFTSTPAWQGGHGRGTVQRGGREGEKEVRWPCMHGVCRAKREGES